MAFDVARGQTVLFGGYGNSYLNDTWTWNGLDWTLHSPSSSPPVRFRHAMAYDQRRARIVLFGGWGPPGGAFLNDTWEWDGSTWQQRLPLHQPPARWYSVLAYDDARQRMVLFGGQLSGTGLQDTWEWDGNDWTLRTTSASPCVPMYQQMFYDVPRRRIVAASGLTMWEYVPVTPATYTRFGVGCAGSGGTPSLAAAGGSLPWLGDSFTQQITQLPGGGFVAFVFGASNTTWAGGPLPLALGFVGMPGCTLYASGEATLLMPINSGTATVSGQICNCPQLIGGVWHSQAVVFDAAANTAGLTTSNAATARIGAR
jgi:hypothetical protein